MKFSCAVCVLVVLAAVCTAQDGDPCAAEELQDSCDACISSSHLCSWCPFLPNVTTAETRCRSFSVGMECPTEVTPEYPLPRVTVIKNEPLTDTTDTTGTDFVQVSPQNISLDLRRSLTSSFDMTFRSLRNAPLDLYFLIDFSSSQNQVLFILQRDFPQIVDSVRRISTNFQMGFGSFVDKATLPFALSDYRINSTNPGDVNETLECRGFGACAPTYTFLNTQPLTSDVTRIALSFNDSAELSSNIDNPEGGLEALLQVAVCTNETGWRPNALHMVFFITDRGYHIAGDGKLAGIVRPNDGLCHLEKNEDGIQQYTYDLLQDYPSVFQVRQILEANLIVPVFTLRTSAISARRVNQSLVPTYQALIEELSETQAQSFVFEVTIQNVLDVIETSYAATVQNIRVNSPSIPGYTFSIDPISGCDDQRADGSCQLQFDEEVTYNVSVTLDDCAIAGTGPQRVQLLGPPFSFTTIDMTPLCQCDCTGDGVVVNSPLCTDRGDSLCGVCNCGDTYFGDECECDDPIDECPSDSLTADCSGNGICGACGTCRCLDNFFGDGCQCVQNNCTDSCSGQGDCSCGDIGSIPVCVCAIDPVSQFRMFENSFGTPGNCECSPSGCYNPDYPGELCHFTEANMDGREFCGCTSCTCPVGFVDPGDNTCIPDNDCGNEVETCARCRLGDIDNTTATCDISICQETIRFLGEGMTPDEDSLPCPQTIDNCEYVFYLDQMNSSLTISSYSLIRCTNVTLPWIITGSVVGAILLLGLIFLIILKICLLFWDRIEYKKFTQELKDADFAPHENPLYLTPQQDYPNPIRRPSKREPPRYQE